MPVEQLYLLAATLFRVVVVLSGTFTTYLGYRLLLRGIGASQHTQATDASARFGKAQFSLRRLTPGAAFALFGMCLISIMLYVGMPEFRQETNQNGNAVVMRGDANATSDAILQAADQLLKSGNLPEASKKYVSYFQTFATASNNFAWVLLQQSRTEEAITLSRLATSLKPGDDNFINTYTAALAQAGQKAEADRVNSRETELRTVKLKDSRQTMRDVPR